MAFTGNRPLSPSIPQQSLSFRLIGNSPGEVMNRRTSYKGKERVVDDTEPPSPSLYTFVPRPPSRSSMSGSTSTPTSPSSKRSSVLSTASSSSRNSALLEFSPFKFGRKKKLPPPRQNPNLRMNLILPDVLEISAANSLSTPPAGEDADPMEDEETRERVRLREEAAQALGLSIAGHQNHSDDYSESGHSVASNGTLRIREEDRTTEILDQADGELPTLNNNHHYQPSPLTSTTSLHPPLSPTSTHGRNRSGSMPPAFPYHPSALPPSLQQNSNQAPLPLVTAVPSFPSTPRALASFIQTASSGTLPKYYPSSSLRIFAMSKQWKSRHLVLTSPTNVPSGSNSLPLTFVSGSSTSHVHVSYLHLFKSASPDEREMERLEITEDSVVFISEEEIGGKKGVVQVAGVDVGFVSDGKKAGSSKKDSAKTKDKEQVKGREQAMWLFHIADPLEKQRWIESIKNKVFGQRTIRAGLGSSLPFSSLNEPRGDMDVMMSMRAQAVISPTTNTTSPTRSTFSSQDSTGNGYPISPASPTTPTVGSHSVSGHDAASVSSTRSSKRARPSSSHGKSPSVAGIGSGAVLSLKGLFGSKTAVGHTSGRQRSSSRASGVDEWDDPPNPRGARVERTESVVSVGSSKSSVIPKGNNLISILRATSPPNEGSTVGFISSGSGMGVHAPAVDFSALGIHSSPAQTPQSQLDRKILQRPLAHDDHDGSMTARPLLFGNDTAAPFDTAAGGTREDRRTPRTLSVSETFSLQPPPRKRWTSTSDVHTPPVLNTPSSHQLQLQESPFIKDRRNLDDFDVLGGAPSISRLNTSGSGSLTPEPPTNSSPATKRTSGQSAFSFSFGTPPGSGNLDVEYRPRSLSSRSARSARSGQSVRSGDTAEEELEELDVPVSGFDGHSSSSRTRRASGGSGFGSSPDVDKRSSMSSGKRNSVGVSQGKRWSRQLPKRLTPPSGPPPAAPSTPPSSPAHSVIKGTNQSPVKSLPKILPTHPYSGAATEQRASMMTTRSTRSTSSRPSSSHSSVVSNLPSFSKRASASSAMSVLSTTSLQASGTTTPVSSGTHAVGNGITGHTRPTSSHRSSLAPPPRPAPTFALPPAPGEASVPPMLTPPMSAPVSSTNNKSSFRDSITSRAFRLSLMAPKPPPSGVLPPRPDELEHPKSPTSSIASRNTHRRSQSGNNSPLSGGPGSLYSIPGSPVPPSAMDAVHVTRGPLPPTPVSGVPASTPSRGVSIKQRLRILSAPSPSSAPPASPRSSTRPTTIMAPLTGASPPGTPTFAHGLTHYFENSGSFHAVATPTTPSLPAPKIHHVEDEPDVEPELTSLSPPPRRGSKRISLPEVEAPPAIPEDEPSPLQRMPIEDNRPNDTNKPFSLSRPASVISFGVVNV
ncbi:hypothetical protein HHX47_DHR4000254 [Lentinula edodes]|nr:hypothetical protein HHX47_DHR4000254 [Lentinula edodes]